ncbi:hypothetical protein OIU74_008868 [Salix koriyanagi]|uniref:Uncharacterized protein n=1 Tax=Salix koriyanagi TaxID=2511006 RepID=A0A9Q0TR00_9ROSI|nr:hypothetical protein OIU74_008868 [Salix koriyanagi]
MNMRIEFKRIRGMSDPTRETDMPKKEMHLETKRYGPLLKSRESDPPPLNNSSFHFHPSAF